MGELPPAESDLFISSTERRVRGRSAWSTTGPLSGTAGHERHRQKNIMQPTEPLCTVDRFPWQQDSEPEPRKESDPGCRALGFTNIDAFLLKGDDVIRAAGGTEN